MIAAAAMSSEQLAELTAQHLAQHQVTPWGNTLQHLVLWSPGLLILIGLYYLIRKLLPLFVQFVASQERMATAVEQATSRDRDRLDEILVGQQLILSRMDSIERRLPHGPH
jgi:hypothetical protein